MSAGFFAGLRGRTNLLRIAGHGAWLFGDRALRAALGLAVGAVVARHLGPDAFGTLSLALAYVMLFAAVAQLGLDGGVIRDLSKDPSARSGVLGTAFSIKLGCAALVYVLGNGLLRALDAGPEGLWVLVAAGSAALFFYSADVIDFYFQSQLKGRAIAVARTGACVFASAVRLALVAIGAPLVWFAAAPAIEAAVAAALLAGLYLRREGSPRDWTIEKRRARELVGTALPVAVSGFFVMAIMQVDKLLLEEMAGTRAVGIYSAAAMLSAAWYMVPAVAGTAVAPRLTALYESSRADYAARLQDVFSVLTLFTLCAGGLIALAAKPLIVAIFGAAYAEAALILTIHLWTGVFVAHVSIRTWALLIEGNMGLILVFSGLTLAANVLLNLVLIDRYAAAGAAWASLISWALGAALFPLASARARRFVGMLLQSFVPAAWARALTA